MKNLGPVHHGQTRHVCAGFLEGLWNVSLFKHLSETELSLNGSLGLPSFFGLMAELLLLWIDYPKVQ